MKTVLVTPELAFASVPGDVGAFAWHWARLLRQAGEDVHLILTRPPLRPSREWRAAYDDLGATLEVLEEPERFIALPHGYRWQRRMAETVFEHLPPDADIVYYAERDANAMHHLRRRRFTGERLPLVATVLHGGSAWQLEAALRWPTRLEDLEQDFFERYVTAHSDWVIAPNQALLRWAAHAGWCLPPGERTRVAGYPFLPEAAAAASARQMAPREPKGLAAELSDPGFRRLICLTMPAARGDVALFTEALAHLRDNPCLDSVQEVVLLGCPGDEPVRVGDVLDALRHMVPGRTISGRLDASPGAVRALLAEAAPDALVVVPRCAPGMDYAVIAASQVPELALMCADVGGIAGAMDSDASDELFEPFPAALAHALEHRLLPGSRSTGTSNGYAWQAANERWLALHHEIAAEARTLRDAGAGAASQVPANRSEGHRDDPVATSVAAASGAEQPARSVDVCVTYYNLGTYLPQLLEALDKQTAQDFNLFVVNDGSSDPSAVAVFDAMARAYAHHSHWRFVTTANQGVCAARNLAASLGNADYLCFVDGDNVPLPSMIERFLACIRQSGDDCLTCYLYTIEREGAFKSGLDMRQSPLVHYLPVGNCLPLGVFTNPFGDINCIMRRAAFEAIGGFTTDVTKFINHEDRELLTRLAFGGYRLDVIPEFLCYYRQRAHSRLRDTDQYLNDARVMRVYLERLHGANDGDLANLAPLALGLLHRDNQYGAPQSDPNLLHYLTFEVSAVVLAKALARRLRHHLSARLNRTHRL